MADAPSASWVVPPSSRRRGASLWFVLGSVALHVVGFWALDAYVKSRPAPESQKPMELVMFEVEKPKPPPPREEPPPPKAPKIRPKIRAPAPEKPLPEPPSEKAPPPPNDTPPPEPTKPVPLVVGISMSSTTTAGNFAAPVGNTLYGKSAEKAVSPDKVQNYGAKRYVPVYQVDMPPSVLAEVKPEYTEAARQAGVEGQVVVTIVIEPDGSVSSAKLVRGLGYGLDESALRNIRRYRFKPAIQGGEPVSTSITFTITFVLD